LRAKDARDADNRASESKSALALSVLLDYLKVIMWPAVIIMAILVFKGDIRSLLARIQKIEAAGNSATFGTEKPPVPTNPNAPDVYFSLPDNLADNNCQDRAQDALSKSGFGDVQKGEVTYGYADNYVGAVWCRAQNPILITVAGPHQGLSKKQADLEKRFRGEVP
jgi:hypothetical protein